MLRIATIGTSMITDDFIQVVNANDQAAFVGTLSRDADRGAAFTTKHGGERYFTALDELASAADGRLEWHDGYLHRRASPESVLRL